MVIARGKNAIPQKHHEFRESYTIVDPFLQPSVHAFDRASTDDLR